MRTLLHCFTAACFLALASCDNNHSASGVNQQDREQGTDGGLDKNQGNSPGTPGSTPHAPNDSPTAPTGAGGAAPTGTGT